MIECGKQGAVQVIRSDTPLDAENVEEANSALELCIQQGQPRVVFDFGRVPLIDSAGLELLLNTHDRCQQRGGALKLAGLNPLCSDILRITGVAAQVEICGDVTEAAGGFAQ